MNVVVFGTGLYFLRRKHMLPKTAHIIAFIDNDSELWESEMDGVKIEDPHNVHSYSFDAILLASGVPNEMRLQLLAEGIPNDYIYYWEEFIAIHCHGELTKYGESILSTRGKQFLIIVPIINYAGGFLTALNAGIVRKQQGDRVVIVAPIANDTVIPDIISMGIEVWICPSFPYIGIEEMAWIEPFDYVLCNSLQTIICATQIKKGKNLLLWIHEHTKQYEDILLQYAKYCNFDELSHINVCAVSSLGCRIAYSFLKNYQMDLKTLPFGIMDSKKEMGYRPFTSQQMVFAVIGNISPLKNQLFFVEAVKALPDEIRAKMVCKIVGRDVRKFYRKQLDEAIKDCDNIELTGELTNSQVRVMLQNIDVVVCVSTEETMSMTIVEGLMSSKICVTNDNTGVAQYIEDGKNGFVYRKDDLEDLRNKIQFILRENSQLSEIRKNARETYEKVFSLQAFEERLDEVFR